ncbi:hypothetical protein V1477_000299 [Vespula maculifrons]|uniref:Uncharacterized protein n=1 Tax=Vespula maculifrons TaxID=7453 RepID=A0ABD2D1F9_VESMC
MILKFLCKCIQKRCRDVRRKTAKLSEQELAQAIPTLVPPLPPPPPPPPPSSSLRAPVPALAQHQHQHRHHYSLNELKYLAINSILKLVKAGNTKDN